MSVKILKEDTNLVSLSEVYEDMFEDTPFAGTKLPYTVSSEDYFPELSEEGAFGDPYSDEDDEDSVDPNALKLFDMHFTDTADSINDKYSDALDEDKIKIHNKDVQRYGYNSSTDPFNISFCKFLIKYAKQFEFSSDEINYIKKYMLLYSKLQKEYGLDSL